MHIDIAYIDRQTSLSKKYRPQGFLNTNRLLYQLNFTSYAPYATIFTVEFLAYLTLQAHWLLRSSRNVLPTEFLKHILHTVL